MGAGETGFADVTCALIAAEDRALEAGHDYGQDVRDGENGGPNDIAQFFRDSLRPADPDRGVTVPDP